MPKSKANFDDIRARADRLITSLADRDALFETWDKMYRLEPEGVPTDDYVQELYDPTPHNVVEMIARMYASNPPTISVPSPSGKKAEREKADRVERFLRALVYSSDRVRGKKMAADLLRAISIFDEETILIDNWGMLDPNALCPFILEVPHPKLCYVEYGRRGVRQHAYRATLTLGDIRDYYGEKDTAFLTGADDDELTVVDWVDKTTRCAWVEEQAAQPICLQDHNLGFVPRQAQLCTAPSFEVEQQHKRMSLLYTLNQAKLWQAACLSLTLANSNTFALLNPQWVKKSINPVADRGMRINLSETGRVHIIAAQEDISVLQKQLIPPEQMQMLAQIAVLSEASTMPKILAGTAPFSGITASATHILSTNAALVARPIAESAGWALSSALSIILKWIVQSGKPVKVRGEQTMEELAPSDILAVGEDPYIEIVFKPDVSMERQVNVQIAQALRTLGAGFDTIFELLEQAGIIRSAEEARKDMLVTRFIELNLKDFAAEAAKEAGAQLKEAKAVGLPPALTVEGAGQAPPMVEQPPAMVGQPTEAQPMAQAGQEVQGVPF